MKRINNAIVALIVTVAVIAVATNVAAQTSNSIL